MYIQFNKRKLKYPTAGRQKSPNKIIIYLRYIAKIALYPFYRRKHLDTADNIMSELIRTIITEIFCLTAKQETSFQCPKVGPLILEHTSLSPLDLLCPPLFYTKKAMIHLLLKCARGYFEFR